jgi:hypothetical protein
MVATPLLRYKQGNRTSAEEKRIMAEQDVAEELARLRAENEALKKTSTKPVGISYKVSEKGGVSVYGMGRFPVTLYVEQWETLLGRADELRDFIEANRSKLKKKE